MSTQFSSIEMIQEEFNLNEESHDSIRSILKHLKSRLHPDKVGGKFTNDQDKSQFLKLDNAIKFIDSVKVKKTDLVTSNSVTELTEAVTALVSSQAENTSKNTKLSNEINKSIVGYSSKLKMPRIALTAVSVALSALWVFPATVEKHPILSNIIDFTSITTNFIWGYALLCCLIFWVRTWRSEELTKTHRESLSTEFVQNRLFSKFINENEDKSFVIEDLIEFLMHFNIRHHSPIHIFLGSPQKMDIPLANATAEVMIERGVKRKSIIGNDSGAISTVYSIVAANKPIKQD